MEQKKKFRFNIVDGIVLLIIVAAAAFFLWKTVGGAGDGETVSTVSVRYVVQVNGLNADMYAEVEKCLPFTMVASGKALNGTVVSCTSEPCTVAYLEASNPVNNALNQWLLPNEGDSFVNAYFVCEAEMDVSDGLNQVGTQEVRIGRNHYVKGLDVELVGTVISLEKLG